MKVFVIAGMIDAKLRSKILPLQAIEEIDEIVLFRREKYQGDKINCISPPVFMLRFMPLAELFRIVSLCIYAILQRPSVLVAFGTIPHGLYAWVLGKLFKLPVIQHVMGKNDLRLTFKNQRGKQLALHAVKEGDGIAVRGQRMREWLITKGANPDRIFVPQNLHDFALFEPTTQKPSFDLIYVGLLSPYKRVDLLLRAFALLVEKQPERSLLVVGDGNQREQLLALSEALNISGNVTFKGAVSYEQLPSLFKSASVFTMTSQGEGLPMAMIEALSCGLPVVIYADPDSDICDIAEPGKNAVLVKEQTAEKFADSYYAVLNDADIYHTLKQGALTLRQEYSEEYSLAFQSALWKKQLERVAGSGV